MYKKCSKCKEIKLFGEFHKSKSTKDGYHAVCKICRKNYSQNNKEHINMMNKNYYSANKEKIVDWHKDYYTINKEKIVDYSREYRKHNKHKVNISCRDYKRNNKSKIYALNAKRRAMKIKATPSWLNQTQLDEIVEFYEIAQMFKLYTGQEYHVDHIVPLQGENVCGLHVPWNLQVIPAKENLSKSNKLLEN